jgi:hypothetical protein
MTLAKDLLQKLNRFATAFREARDRAANESDTVMYLVKFFEEILEYDSLKGEISKELAIKDRYCDIALKVDGAVQILVECKASGLKGLSEKHIEQAENYASRSGITWVLLTNGIEWRLYHLTFVEAEGIVHDLAFELNLLEELERDPEAAWEKLSLLGRAAIDKGLLEEYWKERKALSPASIVRALFSQDVLAVLRRELRREAKSLLGIEDVFAAVRDLLSKEALMEAGDITLKKRRKKRRKVTRTKTDPTTGATVTEEVEEETEEGDEAEPCSGRAND